MDKDIKTNDGIDISKCKVSRKSIVGNINKIALVPAVAVALVVGTVTVYGSYIQKMEKYEYNSNYESYSEQIESMLGIDLDNNLENNLNSMKVMRETIEDYQSDNALISQADALKVLIDGKTDFEIAALNIAKSWCANEWGGKAEDYKIIPEDSKSPNWIAVDQVNKENYMINGDIEDLVEAIGKLQGYNKEVLETVSNPDKFVDICDDVAKYSGIVATSIAESKSSSK